MTIRQRRLLSEFPYKLGRRPGRIPVGLRDLSYYVAGELPQAPPRTDYPTFTWGMLGNDKVGDCGVAGLEHGFEADAVVVHEQETWPDTAEAVHYYFDYTGGQDSGVVLSDYLEYVRKNGYYGHHVHAYAPVEVANLPLLHTCVWMYGFAYTGITVTNAMQEAFSNGQPWTTSLLNSSVAGGHCIPLVGYDDQYLYAVTWGKIQPITYPMWHYIASEAWAVLTGEFVAHHGNGRGVNLDALVADIKKFA